MGTLRFKGSSGLTLPCYRCQCGNYVIQNWNELKGKPLGKYTRLVETVCNDCGWVYCRVVRLTARTKGFKLIRYDWIWLGCRAMKWLPWEWFQKLVPWIWYMEARFPL